MGLLRYKYFFLLIVALAGFFALSQNVSAAEYNGEMQFECRVDAVPFGANKSCPPDGGSRTRSLSGQMYKWEYRAVQQDEPAAAVEVCISTDGVWRGSGSICWVIQNRGTSNVPSDSDSIDNYSGGYRTEPFRYFSAEIQVRSDASNDNNHIGYFKYYSRQVEITSLGYSANPIAVGGATNMEWTADFGHEQRLAYTDTDGTTGEDNPGLGDQSRRGYTDSLPYVNENGVPGIVDYRLKVWGPLASGSYGYVETDFPSLTVIGNMTGTLTANYSTCTKSGSNTCNLVLTYGSTNATDLHIQKDTEDWRFVTVPNGTTTEIDPTIGTHTYQLIGTDGGAWVGLASVTVTIYPETVSGPGPRCAPSFVESTAGVAVRFDASNGTNYVWSTRSGATLNTGTPPNGAGVTFNTSFATSGTHTVTVTANGESNSCTLYIAGPPLDPPVTCSPASDTGGIYSTKTFTAGGGNGVYSWAVSADASFMTGAGNSFSTTFNAAGNKTVTVTSGSGSADCVVSITTGACSNLAFPASGSVLPAGTTTTTFGFDTSVGRSNYILDLSTDAGMSWWWNNGTGGGGPGYFRAISPITSRINIPLGDISNTFWSGGRPAPVTLSESVPYYWRVYAYDPANQAASECRTGIISFSVGSVVPVIFINYEAAEIEDLVLSIDNDICRRLRLNWTFTSSGVAQGFRVYRSDDGTLGTFSLLTTINNNTQRTYSDNTPVVGEDYYYRVDPFTNAAPPRQKPSNVVVSTARDCTADFSPSTYNIYQVNGAAYVPGVTTVVDGDAITFRIVVSNIGPANGAVNSMINTMSNNLTAFRNYTINKGSTGSVATAISATASGTDQTINMGLTGTKCVSPDNPTSCGNSTDRSCVNSPLPICNNWVLTFTATVDVAGAETMETIDGVARLQFTDGTGIRFLNIPMLSNLFQTGNRLPPEFREVAP